MTLPTPTYDLVLLLDPQTEQPLREKIVADALQTISADGELVGHNEWGERALAYQIDHKATAEYHLLQFHPSSPGLVAELNRSLSIADGVIRFRINKLKPGTPAAPEMRPERAGATHVRDETDEIPTEAPLGAPA